MTVRNDGHFYEKNVGNMHPSVNKESRELERRHMKSFFEESTYSNEKTDYEQKKEINELVNILSKIDKTSFLFFSINLYLEILESDITR